jgi:transcriptional regulator GlxA family with amidase domain
VKTIAIPALRTAGSLGAVGPFELLGKTCGLWRQHTQTTSGPLFDVCVVSSSRKPIAYPNGVTITPTATFHACRPDIIVVPSIDEEVENSLKQNATCVSWLRKCFQQGAHVSSICTGAFVLAAAGILDGKQATTHWYFAEQFKRRFPHILLRDDQVIVDEGRVVTCGAATSFLNLIIYLVGKHFGHDLAVLASKIFLIDMDRPSQLPYRIFRPAITHNDTAIVRCQEFINLRLKANLPLGDLAKQAAMSPRNFSRRFKAATGDSVAVYIQKLRIEAAKRLFETSDLSAAEVTYRAGYTDERSFRRLFKRYTGLGPKNYRAKFKLRSPINKSPAATRRK